MPSIPGRWDWFPESRYGLFLHWGPYAQYGRGEQVMFREHMDPQTYIDQAVRWNPDHFDAAVWADFARESGFRYAVLTSRHHDGYCLWNTKTTDYSSMAQVPQRDFVGEFVQAFRNAGLRIGIYYSLLDWRLPAYFEGPEVDPDGWQVVCQYIHNQTVELLSNYGKIDYFWFDGVWPRSRIELQASQLVRKMRELQPDILINNRLGGSDSGDVGTPEHHITAENRLWESCQVSTWRLWGYATGERWRSTDVLLDMLCECAHKGGNLLLNVGPQPDGQLPEEFRRRARQIGDWLTVHGEAVYGTDGGDITEFITHGWQTTKGNHLYLIFRFWSGEKTLRLPDLTTKVLHTELLTTRQSLPFEQVNDTIIIKQLPAAAPTALFPVIKLVCDSKPSGGVWAEHRLWQGDPRRISEWAKLRGNSVFADGNFNSVK
ncbi:MAG: alpha-L-fucosidase [Anaerolineae bacterium]|nr:alpha-L-fucosidase [Anaerolineae bacterium]